MDKEKLRGLLRAADLPDSPPLIIGHSYEFVYKEGGEDKVIWGSVIGLSASGCGNLLSLDISPTAEFDSLNYNCKIKEWYGFKAVPHKPGAPLTFRDNKWTLGRFSLF